VPTLSNQVPPYSTFLIDKGRAPARSGVARSGKVGKVEMVKANGNGPQPSAIA
jgi:hypothetical protein